MVKAVGKILGLKTNPRKTAVPGMILSLGLQRITGINLHPGQVRIDLHPAPAGLVYGRQRKAALIVQQIL